MPEVQNMNPEQHPHAQAERDEDKIRQLDQDLRFLNWQISKLEKMVRTALEQMKTVDLSPPDMTCQYLKMETNASTPIHPPH
jgi:hypothetical protein